MTSTTEKPKFPKFMGHIHSQGINIKLLTNILKNKGYDEYNYNNVRRKLRGDAPMEYEDIIVFSEVMGVDESIFFN